MPRPLGEYKDDKEELAIVADEKKMKEEEEFYTQFFLKDGDPLYAGVHGPELLEKERKRKHDPSLRAPSCFEPIHDKAELAKYDVSKRTATRYSPSCSRAESAPVPCSARNAPAYLEDKLQNERFLFRHPLPAAELAEARSGGISHETAAVENSPARELTFTEGSRQDGRASDDTVQAHGLLSRVHRGL